MIYKSLFNVANIINKLYICTYMIHVYTCVMCTIGYVKLCMRNAGLEEAQAGIKIARRNINNLRYADDPTLMAES